MSSRSTNNTPHISTDLYKLLYNPIFNLIITLKVLCKMRIGKRLFYIAKSQIQTNKRVIFSINHFMYILATAH